MSRADDIKRIADLIASAARDQDAGLMEWSAATAAHVDHLLLRLGHQPPSRVTTDGLIELIEEVEVSGDGRVRRYPLVFKTRGALRWRHVTVEKEHVNWKGEEYAAIVVTLHDD